MAMKIEADSDDAMEYLFAHYGASAELQHGIQPAFPLRKFFNDNYTFRLAI